MLSGSRLIFLVSLTATSSFRKLPQASENCSNSPSWVLTLDSLLVPPDLASEAVECAGLRPRLCVFQATDKRKALEETMAFTTQALASVAYQVGNLAGNTLRMLDLQVASLRQVEAKMSTLSQVRVWEGTPPPFSPSSSVPLKCSLQQKSLAFLYSQIPPT